MFCSPRLLVALKCPPIHGLDILHLVLIWIKKTQVVDVVEHQRVLWPSCLLEAFQWPPIHTFGFLHLALMLIQITQSVNGATDVSIILRLNINAMLNRFQTSARIRKKPPPHFLIFGNICRRHRWAKAIQYQSSHENVLVWIEQIHGPSLNASMHAVSTNVIDKFYPPSARILNP